MKTYTVVLLRPEYLCEDEPYGKNVYVALITADSEYKSIPAAQAEVFKADIKDGSSPKTPEDYEVCLVFEGHIIPKLWGWML